MCPAVIQMYLKSVLGETVKLFEGKRKKHYLDSRRGRNVCWLLFVPVERQAVVTGGGGGFSVLI